MLQKLGFAPGFNKQVTETGAEGQWFDGDFVRFRYGSPEKIGGWSQLGDDKLTGVARAIHHWDDNAGIKFSAIGTSSILYVFSGGVYYDIHPIRATLTGADFTSTSSSKEVTITCTGNHGLLQNDIVMFDTVTGLSGSTFTNNGNLISETISSAVGYHHLVRNTTSGVYVYPYTITGTSRFIRMNRPAATSGSAKAVTNTITIECNN